MLFISLDKAIYVQFGMAEKSKVKIIFTGAPNHTTVYYNSFKEIYLL